PVPRQPRPPRNKPYARPVTHVLAFAGAAFTPPPAFFCGRWARRAVGETGMTDRINIAGGTALITGAGKRIGAAVATALAQAGMHVVLHYRESQAEAESVADTCRALGVRATIVQADLSRPEAGAAL